jgi:acetate---CoA ligase (ADP-forming)
MSAAVSSRHEDRARTARPVRPVDVILRDGSTLRLRPPTPADSERLVAFFSALSLQSRYFRFHAGVTARAELAEPFLDPDWDEVGALVGLLGEGAEERIVALASYARLRDPSSAEAAFAVEDALQGRGVGTRLLEQLAARAAKAGIERFVAEVLPDNRSMLDVFASAGFETTRELAGGVVEVAFPIAPTQRLEARVDDRDHAAVVASLRPFFEPASVAVVGASPRRGSIGGELFRNLLEADFAGVAYPVNRGGASVAGVRAYASVDELPEIVELAVLCLPGESVLEAAAAALRHGVRALCVISAGFAETGHEGKVRQERLLDLVRAHGGRLIGPNCLGVAASGVRLNATFAPRPLPPGNLAVSSQSGALGLALLAAAEERGLGFSSFVSIGNKADVSSNDLLEWWEDDEAAEVVVLYLESFGNPRKFARIARRVARRKPILALKSGRTATGARAASSHTAALAGSEAAANALFAQAGVLRLETLEELLDLTELLSTQPPPKGRRVAVLTNAGGLGILCADACEAAGLELPSLSKQTAQQLTALLPREASLANPVDMLGSATAAEYERVLPVLLADPRVDAVIALFVPPVVARADDVAAAIARASSTQEEKPVLAVVISPEGTPPELRDGPRRIAAFAYPESAARALGHAAERGDWLRRPAGAAPLLGGIDRAAARAVADAALAGSTEAWLSAAETRALLQAYGLPLVEERVAADVDAAAAAAAELGYPVVVKSAAAGAHKTEQGGVALDLRDDAAVRAAAELIGAPVLVQPLVSDGVELLAGVVQDPVFGPLVAFGPGGVQAELIGGAGFCVAPLTDLDATELVTTGKAGRLVAGFRGAPAADVGALTGLLHRLAQLAEDLPELAELDLNPVLAGPDGCVAVDARVRLRRVEHSPRAKSW